MTAEDRVSSLRIRIGRVRGAFGRKMDVAKLAFGIVIVVFTGVGLYLVF